MRGGRDVEAALDEFVELWGRLRAESEREGAIVVVEGERDRRALRRLGLRAPILLVHRGQPLSETAHRLARASRHVIVLTDWDGEGGLFARRLREFLGAGPVILDLDFRRELGRILRGELVHVEGLYGWARRLAERRHVALDQLLAPALAD